MNKKIKLCLVCFLSMFCVVGCNAKTATNVSFTYAVETGDSIKVTLDTADNYTLIAELPFSISNNGEILSQGMFVTSENYSQYINAVNADEKAIIIESGTKDDNEYVCWKYNDVEFNYAILVKDSNTAVIIGNTTSQGSAKECFERLTFTKTE